MLRSPVAAGGTETGLVQFMARSFAVFGHPERCGAWLTSS
jgi:hypothetical protein